jgi:predicted MFS family arabinose efflux permease
LLGGWIADTKGFEPTFGLSAMLSVVMMGILWFIVKDPRKLKQENS